jgi:hypothetical protein
MAQDEGDNKSEQKPVPIVDWTLRMTILVLLAAQNAAHALMSRYSKAYLRQTSNLFLNLNSDLRSGYFERKLF